jgi:hypothetical protein
MNSTSPTKIQGDADAAVTESRKLRMNGPWTLAAIPVEGGAPEVASFKGAEEVANMREWIAARNGKKNLYWMLNPTRKRMNRKPTKADVARFDFAHVECDPLPGETSADAKRRHRAKLKGMKKPPSLIYDSGNGVVGVWKIKRPVTIARGDVNAIAECEAVNIGLKLELGGKAEGVDDCQNSDRLLRLPHTVNLPDAKKRAAGRVTEIAGNVETFPQRTYSLAELPVAADVPKAEDGLTAIGGAETVDDLDELPLSDRTKEIIRNGKVEGETKDKDNTRSAWRFEAVCAMLRADVPPELVLGILTDPQYEISERALEFGDRAEEYARKEIERAMRKIAAAKAKELDEDFDEPIDTNAGGDDEDTTPTPRKTIIPTPYVWIDPKKIPRREWIYKPFYIRKFAGSTVATGGAGKSSLLLVESVAMASGKNLLGVEPAPDLRVWYWNGEDPQDELQRRVQAILKHYNVAAADIEGRFFLDSGRDLPIRIAELQDGKTKIAVPVVKQMIEAILDLKIDCLGIDPWVSSHGVPENDNNAIDQVAKKWADIADKTNSHIHISHHTRKTNGLGAMAEDSRGASSLNNAMRTRRVINTMSGAEADRAGIVGNARLSYFKADTAGSSMTKPAEALEWCRFESVQLGNGNGFDVQGDEVGVVVKWDYKPLGLDLSPDDASVAIAALEAGGPWREQPRSAKWAGLAVANAMGLDVDAKGVKKQIEAMLTAWVEDGSLERYQDETSARQLKWFLRPAMDFD